MTEGEVVAEDDAVVVEDQVKKVPRDKCLLWTKIWWSGWSKETSISL